MREDYDLAFLLKYENVAWYEDGHVKILDRRMYPQKIQFVECFTYKDVVRAIADMVTQSAGPYTACGMGMALAAFECRNKTKTEQLNFLQKAADELTNARLTTKNRLKQITDRSLQVAKSAIENEEKVDEALFLDTVNSLNRRYKRMSIVAKYLIDLFPNNSKVLTQCFGETIVGMMIREAQKYNKKFSLFVPETRPFLQGARLTASVASEQGIDTTVITDNMVAHTIKTKGIDLFTSAADSIALDGHIVNKVGTMQIAILAKYFGIPYFVTGIPDKDITSIKEVKIEERNPKEVLECNGIKNTLDLVKGYYPAFDITPPYLVSSVVTDKGIYSPYNLKDYFKNDYKPFY